MFYDNVNNVKNLMFYMVFDIIFCELRVLMVF